jgi:hypothetical protein
MTEQELEAEAHVVPSIVRQILRGTLAGKVKFELCGSCYELARHLNDLRCLHGLEADCDVTLSRNQNASISRLVKASRVDVNASGHENLQGIRWVSTSSPPLGICISDK